MARKPRKPRSSGGKARKGGFIRDAIGRFARAGGEAIGKAAKAAMAEASDELAAVATENAKRAVRAAEEEFRRAAKEYKQAKKASEIDDDDFDDIEAKYKKAIKTRAKAKAELAAKGK